jgi:hypothetical protein
LNASRIEVGAEVVGAIVRIAEPVVQRGGDFALAESRQSSDRRRGTLNSPHAPDIHIHNWPARSMYQPDAIAACSLNDRASRKALRRQRLLPGRRRPVTLAYWPTATKPSHTTRNPDCFVAF